MDLIKALNEKQLKEVPQVLVGCLLYTSPEPTRPY